MSNQGLEFTRQPATSARRGHPIDAGSPVGPNDDVAALSANATTITQAPQINIASFPALAGTTHSRTLRRLPPAIYFYRVRSHDGSSPIESAEGTFTLTDSDRFPLGDLAFNEAVTTITKGSNTWYVGGNFTSVGPATGNGVSLEVAGTLREAHFPEVGGTSVDVAIPDGAGGYYIGGSFTFVGGLNRSNAAHLLPDLGVDPDWNPNLNSTVSAIALLGGSVYLGGSFSGVNDGIIRNSGSPRPFAGAIDVTTGLATSWNPNLTDQTSALVLDCPLGTVALGGRFRLAGPATATYFAIIPAGTDCPRMVVFDAGVDAGFTDAGFADAGINDGGHQRRRYSRRGGSGCGRCD